MSQIISISKTQSMLGENPLWDAATNSLLSIDTMGRKIMRHDASLKQHEEWPLTRGPGSFVQRARGGLLMANRQGLAFSEVGSSELDEISAPALDLSKAVINDGKCDSRGRFWTGTMDRNVAGPTGALYRLDTNLAVTRMDDGFTLSNGIAWSPDDRTMYFCDSRPGHIWAYDYDIDQGTIANRRLHVDFSGRKGHPDGCAIDADGGLWVAEIGTGQVVRFEPSGREGATITLPTSRVTSVAFGGPGLRTLYVTSMRHGLSEDALAREPHAGSIFAVAMDVAGLPAATFNG